MLFGKYVNKYYWKYSFFFLLGIAALLAVNFFQLEIPEIIGDIVDGLDLKSLELEALKGYIERLLVIAAVMFTGRFIWRFCIFGNGIRIESDLRAALFEKTECLSQRFFGENKTGALMALYTNDLLMIRRTFGGGIVMLVDAVSLGTLALIKMLKIHVAMSLISLCFMVIIMIVSRFIGSKIKKATDVNFRAYGRLCDYVQEDLQGISVVKAFVKENLQMRRFLKYNRDNMDTTLKITRISTKLQILIMVSLSLLQIGVISFGAWLIINDPNFTLGILTKFLAYLNSLIWPIMAVGRLIGLRSQGQASLNRIAKVMDEPVEINDDKVDPELSFTEPLKGKIEYKNLSFAYPGSDEEVLKNVSFTIEPGEFVGIIGGTGTGKTTIVDLLLRIYNIGDGMLFLDGKDIMKLPIRYVRAGIAYVPQDNFLFGKTITKNIGFAGGGSEDEEKVKECAGFAGVDGDIENFRDRYQTILGERGVTVSGGQKQRLSIARALYKDGSVLILDDSLSAVDTETEKMIITRLRENRHKTTIIIAHRISTLQTLDKIIVVEEGRITGVGSHEELLKTNRYYAREVYLQELEKEIICGGQGNGN